MIFYLLAIYVLTTAPVANDAGQMLYERKYVPSELRIVKSPEQAALILEDLNQTAVKTDSLPAYRGEVYLIDLAKKTVRTLTDQEKRIIIFAPLSVTKQQPKTPEPDKKK